MTDREIAKRCAGMLNRIAEALFHEECEDIVMLAWRVTLSAGWAQIALAAVLELWFLDLITHAKDADDETARETFLQCVVYDGGFDR